MRLLLKNILALITISLLILLISWLILEKTDQIELFGSVEVLTLSFSVITLISVIIFNRGLSRDARSQTFHTFVSISLKFLLELVLALMWFIVLKKTYSQSVLMFFILYLSFSLILIISILKSLKTKSL